MENSLLAPFAERGTVFPLNENKLLDKLKYENILKEFDKF